MTRIREEHRVSPSTNKEVLKADHEGVGLLLPTGGRLLWTISTPSLWRRRDGNLYINYEGVGGGVEEGESFEDAAIRECKEETGCVAQLESASRSFLIDEVMQRIGTTKVPGPSPVLVWRKRLLGGKTLLAYAFLATLTGRPRPLAEVPALLYSPKRLITKRGTFTLRELLEGGSELRARTSIPESALVRPWGTPYYVGELVRRRMLEIPELPAPAA